MPRQYVRRRGRSAASTGSSSSNGPGQCRVRATAQPESSSAASSWNVAAWRLLTCVPAERRSGMEPAWIESGRSTWAPAGAAFAGNELLVAALGSRELLVVDEGARMLKRVFSSGDRIRGVLPVGRVFFTAFVEAGQRDVLAALMVLPYLAWAQRLSEAPVDLSPPTFCRDILSSRKRISAITRITCMHSPTRNTITRKMDACAPLR